MIGSLEELTAHKSKGIHTVVAAMDDEQLSGKKNERRHYMVTKMIGFPIAILLVAMPAWCSQYILPWHS
jgi:hypothetical protein